MKKSVFYVLFMCVECRYNNRIFFSSLAIIIFFLFFLVLHMYVRCTIMCAVHNISKLRARIHKVKIGSPVYVVSAV